MELPQIADTLTIVVSFLAATFGALWLALIFWAFRDMRSRSRDIVMQVLAGVLVVALNIPGLIIYLVLRPSHTLSEQYETSLEEEALLKAIEEKHNCPGCTHRFEDGWIICPYCHTRLRKPCASCGRLLELSWSICPFCEASQTSLSHPTRNTIGNNDPMIDEEIN